MAEVSSDLRLVTQIGQQYVGICDQFLTEQLGRAYTLPELTQFAETAIATLMASAYTNFREVLGKDQAEAWLKKTLQVGASTIRLLGADALVRFEVNIKDMANNLAKQRQEMRAQATAAATGTSAAPAPAPKCACALNPDGSCPSCLDVVIGMHKSTFIFMREVKLASDNCQKICQVCTVSQTDIALSRVIPEAMASGMTKNPAEMLDAMHGIAQRCGVKEIPITEKALQEMVKK
jgi:hypothetical protein